MTDEYWFREACRAGRVEDNTSTFAFLLRSEPRWVKSNLGLSNTLGTPERISCFGNDLREASQWYVSTKLTRTDSDLNALLS